MNLKQLFCHHVWQVTDKKYLHTVEKQYIILRETNYYTRYNHYAFYETCLKCSKTRIYEEAEIDKNYGLF